MIFTDIRLQNFRSYADSSFELSNSVTIIVGQNAAGKTNLLEAVMVSSIGKSYRGPAIRLVKQDSIWARIDLHTSENAVRTTKIVADKNLSTIKKTFEIDNKEYKRLPPQRTQPVVLFEPNSLYLFQGEPSARREYLDNVVEQLDPTFGAVRSKYQRTLAQRNALLKTHNHSKGIFVWDIRLSQLASEIVARRLELINSLNQRLGLVYSKIASKNTEVVAKYQTKIDTRNYATDILSKLQTNITKDALRGFTSCGPHRDDVILELNKDVVNGVSSRGEIRTILLSLKVVELEILEQSRGLRPTLLLDDVFSELDGARRKSLTEFLKKYQTIITTTDADIITKNFSQNCQIIPL